MSRILYYKDDGGLKIMSAEELKGFYDLVLQDIAANNGPGTISDESGGETYTLIGSFTDTTYTGPSGDEETTITSVEYELYQDLNTVAPYTITRPLKYTSYESPFQLLSDAEITELADQILQFCVNEEGSNSYRLGPGTPEIEGTWTIIGSITDVFYDEQQNIRNLYKKLSSNLPLRRPLKLVDGSTFQIFTDGDITKIANKVRERIVDTGIGQYKFQEDTPEPGTWVNVGTITDTRPQVEEFTASYETSYGGNYTGPTTYTGTIDVTYTAETTYTGPTDVGYLTTMVYTQEVLTPSPITQIEQYQNIFTGSVTVTYTGNFSSATFIPTFYAGPATFSGPAYQVSYTRVLFYANQYLQLAAYVGDLEYTSVGVQDWPFEGTFYDGSITSYTSLFFVASFLDAQFWTRFYTASNTAYFAETYDTNLTNQDIAFNGVMFPEPEFDFATTYTRAVYTGPRYFSDLYIYYLATIYTGATPTFYDQEFYTGLKRYTLSVQYTGSTPIYFIGIYDRSVYVSDNSYAGTWDGLFFVGYYTDLGDYNQEGVSIAYVSSYTRENYWDGASFIGFFAGETSFAGAPLQYFTTRTNIRNVTTPVNYTSEYTTLTERYAADVYYIATFERSYINEVSEYSGTGTEAYDAELNYQTGNEYTNAYEAVYSKLAVEVSDTISTKTLWRRVA